MAGQRVRELAREEPEAFRRVAERMDDQLGEHLMEVLEEETN